MVKAGHAPSPPVAGSNERMRNGDLVAPSATPALHGGARAGVTTSPR